MHNDPNVNIRIFLKHWSLTLGCFFPVSILKAIKIMRGILDVAFELNKLSNTLCFKKQKKNQILFKNGRSFQHVERRYRTRKLRRCQRNIVTSILGNWTVFHELWDFRGKGRFRNSRSSHRYSNGNAKVSFFFWNTTGSFNFDAYIKLIFYSALHNVML